MFNKKAQIGETMTWVVATIIIIVILVIAVFIVSSSPFKGGKKFESKNTKTDLLVTKSFMGYLLTDNIYTELKNEELPLITDSISKSNDELVKKIFIDLYNKQYSGNLWLGVVKEECGWNKYTRSDQQPSCAPSKRRDIPASCIEVFYDRIKLNKDSIIELFIGCQK